MHNDITEQLLRFFSGRGVRLTPLDSFSQSFETIGEMKTVVLGNEGNTRKIEAALGSNTGRLTIIITNVASGARISLGGEHQGDVARQLEEIAKRFPEIFSVSGGTGWVDRPFDWRGYK